MGVDAGPVLALSVIGVLVVLGLVGLAVLAERPHEARLDLFVERAEAEGLAAHAAAIQAAASRAAAVAVETRDALIAAELARNWAWAAQEAAEQAFQVARCAAEQGRHEAARRAGAGADGAGAGRETGTFPIAWTDAPAGADDEADRERTVSRAALSAYRRGVISGSQLREVWLRAGDRDPAQAERELAADRCRIEQGAARRVYDQTAAAVRRAERAAQVAEVAAQALLDEAVQSAAEAHLALLASESPAKRRRRRRRSRRGVARWRGAAG